MIQLDPLWLVILVELGVLAVFANLVVCILYLKRRRRERQTLQTFLQKVKTDAKQRSENIQRWLCEHCGLEENEAGQVASTLYNRELECYQSIARFVLSCDVEQSQQCQRAVVGLLHQYHDPEPGARAQDVPKGQDNVQPTDDEHSPLDLLLAENRRLTEELRLAREHMSQLLSEYVTMFGQGNESEKRRILAKLRDQGIAMAHEAEVERP